jgi:SlyX protein
MTTMDADSNTERRLTDLEIKASYGEDLLDELNKLVAKQQAKIDWLLREVSTLRQQSPTADARTPRNARDELPPHY